MINDGVGKTAASFLAGFIGCMQESASVLSFILFKTTVNCQGLS